jgi:protein SCO1/2
MATRAPDARSRPRWPIWALALLALVGACSRDAKVYDARGIVRDVQKDYAQLVIEHEDIEGLMPAMTMNFGVADPALLERLEVGDRIEFRLEVTAKGYRVLEAKRVGAEEGGGASGLGSAPADLDRAPAFRLTDQEGRSVALADLAGKVVLLDFVYTRCPGPCPILTGRQADVQRALPAALRARTWFVSISLDPAYDTPERLTEYARTRGADLSHWSFLTGPVAEVDAVLAGYGVGKTRTGEADLSHFVVTFLIDGAGRIARRFVGTEDEPAELVRAIERLAG